jgi:hypothetical protein
MDLRSLQTAWLKLEVSRAKSDETRRPAKRNTSISGLLAEQIETLVGEDEAYEQAQRRALSLLERDLHLGGAIKSTRDEWHERQDVRRYERLDLRSRPRRWPKAHIAKAVLRERWADRTVILSTQVLQEFYVGRSVPRCRSPRRGAWSAPTPLGVLTASQQRTWLRPSRSRKARDQFLGRPDDCWCHDRESFHAEGGIMNRSLASPRQLKKTASGGPPN